MTQRVAPNQRGTFRVNRTVVISIFLLLALFAAACSEDGEGPTSIPGDVTTPTSPDATQPPEAQPPDTTQPPATTEAPATTQAPATTEAPEDESDGIPTEVWIILGLVAAVAVLAGVLIGRGRSSSGSNGTEPGDSGGSTGGTEPGDSDGGAGGTG